MTTSTLSERGSAQCVAHFRERQERTGLRASDHHLFPLGTGSRITVCGRIPPWDMKCEGRWGGGDRCDDCGGRVCPDCLAGARKTIEMKGSPA